MSTEPPTAEEIVEALLKEPRLFHEVRKRLAHVCGCSGLNPECNICLGSGQLHPLIIRLLHMQMESEGPFMTRAPQVTLKLQAITNAQSAHAWVRFFESLGMHPLSGPVTW